MNISIPTTLKGYEIRETLGTGGFGAVYRAYQATVGREVAIKVILPGMANQPDFIRRFEAEAQIIARLEHPHITPLYDYWRDPAGAYLVMRWLRGGSLRDVLHKETFLELRTAALLLDQIAGALALAHRNQVIHRDIKPGNILLDEDGNAYLTDFGIAKDLNLDGSQTEADAIVGSLDYISPEQARSEAVTARTDIYSLGVTLFEMIAGHHPFHEVSSIERLYKHINDPLPEITRLDPTVAAGINRVIQKATAKNPEHRYADALAFAADFREAARLDQSSSSVVELLTQREQEILQLLVAGLSNKEIAQQLTVTLSTVKWYINQIYSKLGVRSRVQAMVRARDLNLLGKPMADVGAPTAIATENFRPENPYKGLRAFQSADHMDFFGRERLVARLIKRLGESGEYSRFLAVIGPSGSGKSSLVKAGLLPALWRGDFPGSEKWFIIDMVPGARPLDELEVVLTRIAANHASNLHEHLGRDQHGLLRAASLILPNDNSELVLVIDQFEELFTLVEDDTLRDHFLKLLLATVTDPRSRVRVIITLRADFYDRPLHYPGFGEMIRSRMETILPLSAQELEQAISKPAERVGVRFETGLVASIVADVNYQAGALPLLQYALTELFERREGRLLTHESYQAIGRTVGALARRAEELYHDLDETGREAVRQLFLRLVTLGEGAEDTRRRVPRAELLTLAASPEMMEEILDTYTEFRLLSVDHDPATRTPTVEVAHEAILREWERLKLWINESREEIRIQQQLARLADEWQGANGEDSYLLRGARLAQFEAWAATTRLFQTPVERAYLERSIARQEADFDNALAAKMERAFLANQATQRLKYLVMVLALATVIAVGLSVFAFGERSRAESALTREEEARLTAEESAKMAQSIALASAAKSALLSNNPDQAVALAVAANTAVPVPSAFVQKTLYDIAFAPATARLDRGEVYAGLIRYNADASLMLAGVGNEVILQEVATQAEIARFNPMPEVTEKWVGDLLWLGDTAIVSTFQFDRTGIIVQFDPHTAEALLQYELTDESVFTMAVSPDGKYLVGGTVQGNMYVWDINTGEQVRQLASGHDFIEQVVFDADQTSLWSASDDGKVIRWDFASGEQLQVLSRPDAIAGQIIFSQRGLYTVWIKQDPLVKAEILLWHPETEETLATLALTDDLSSLTLSHDEQTLAAGFRTGVIRLYSTDTMTEKQALYGHTRSVNSLFFQADDSQLRSSANDATLRTWHLEPQTVEHVYAEHTGTVIYTFSLSQDHQSALSMDNTGHGIVWDIVAGAILHEWQFDDPNVRGNLSADGRYVAIWTIPLMDSGCDARSELRLYDARTGRLLRDFATQAGDRITDATFNPTSSILVTTDNTQGCGGPARVWEVETGQQIGVWEGHTSPHGSFTVQFSADGRLAAGGSYDQTAIIWETATGEILHSLPHTNMVIGVAFSPDSRYLLTTSVDGLHLWQVQTGEKIRQYTGHSSMIDRVQFSPNGTLAVSSSADETVIVWNIATGEMVRQFATPQIGRNTSVAAFSRDGQSIYLSTHDLRRVALYLDLDSLLAWTQANRYVRELTCDERLIYQVEPLCEDLLE